MQSENDIQLYVEKARQSTLFTAPVLGPDLERFLEEQTQEINRLAAKAVGDKIEHIYWVGSGNSWVNLYSGKYLLDRFTDIPSDCFVSYEFVWRNPQRLNNKAWAFFASFSGATEDTIAALRHAKKQGAYTIAIVNSEDCLMAQEADVTIAYHSKALYILPMAAVYLFALEVARLTGSVEIGALLKGLYSLPHILSRQYVEEEKAAKELAQRYCGEEIFYVLASGPLYGLGYKFGLTVFMENMRVNGSFMDATEFRHGPAEMLDRFKPVVVVLKGTDESRPVVQRVQDIASNNGARVICYDLADYGDIHPLLAPFILMIPLQWFAVYSALLRGITDLDERVLMGRGIMGRGKGITWP
jgi:fructoselysine 6-phosphate deglycase